MKTFDVLSKDTDIFGKKFLEASAGTGKTFAIEHLFVRLLIEGKEPLLIEEILVVTFTKKATRELKIRIRNNIEQAIDILKSGDIKNGLFLYLIPYFSKKEKTINLLKGALSFFDDAQIFTIHGFCYFMLKSFPVQSDVFFKISDEEKYAEDIKNEVFDYLENLPYSKSQLSIFFQTIKDEVFLEKAISFSKKNEIEGYFDFFKDFKKGLSDFKSDIFNLKKDIEYLISLYPKEISYDFFSQIYLFKNLLKTKKCNIKIFEKLLNTTFSFYDFLSYFDKKNILSEVKNKLFFEFIHKKLYPILNKAKDKKTVFFNLFKDFSYNIKKRLKEKEIFTFDDILEKMVFALNNTDFLKNVQKRYKAAFVDEFQDTDSLQWDIFKKIFFKDDIKAFYLIGDPKQSIYSFRNADLYTYFKALESFEKKSIYSLNTNFRSSFNLLEGLNEIFSKKDWLSLPQREKTFSYVPSFSYMKKKEKGPKITFFKIEGRSKGKTWPSIALEEKYFYPYIAKKIKKYKEEGKNIAVLVKDRFQGKRVENFFIKKKISFSSKTQNLLFETSAAYFLKHIFLATFNPKDINKISIALHGKYINYPFCRLQEKEYEKAMKNFSFLKKILKQKGIGCFFSSFLDMKWQKETTYESMIQKEDLSFYFHTMQLFEYFMELESEKKLSFSDILGQFKRKFLDQRFVKANETKSDVDIITIHSSKGLEFDVVFALGLANRSKISFIEDKKEKNAEKLRQFYVALTRAKKRLFIPYAKDQTKITKKENLSPIELFFEDGAFFKSLEEKGLISIDNLKKEEIVPLKEEERFLLKKPKKIDLFFKKEPIFSFSSLLQKDRKDLEVLFYKKDPNKGVEIGVLVHEIFEELLSGKYKKFFDEELIKYMIKKKIKEKKLEVEEKFLFFMIKNAFYAPFDGILLKDVPIENMHAEVEFFIKDKNFLKGFIDLIFFHKDRYYLIDWKTNFLGDDISSYDKKNLYDAMEKNDYFLQAAIYKKALKKIINAKNFGGIFYIFLRGFQNENKGVYKLEKKDFLNDGYFFKCR